MRKLKRLIATFLSFLVLVTSIPATSLTAFATAADDSNIILGSNGKVTRAEWLHNLVYVFEMVVEEEALPDNYYNDLDETHKYYEDILLAVEFGVVNIEAGGALCPDDVVTREFAASTLNFCLGYQLDENKEYSFTDYDECLEPDSAQIAVERGWFELIEGKFSPATTVTKAEVEFMMDDALEILDKATVDPSYTSTFEFEDDIIVIPDGTEVIEDENGIVHITDCPQSITPGNRFAVYYNGIPSVYTANEVIVENFITSIAVSPVESEEAFVSVDTQGVTDADAMEITPVEGVDVSFEEDNSGISTFATKKMKSLKAKTELELFPGVTADVTVKIKDPKVEYSVNPSYAYVILRGDTEISYNIEANLVEMPTGKKAIELINVNVLGVGNFIVSVEFELSGTASGEVKGYLETGIECTNGDKIRAIKNFRQKQYSSNIEATASVGLKATLGVTKMPVINAYVYAEVGIKAKLKASIYNDDKEPNKCVHFSAYLYAKYGATASVKFGGWKTSVTLNYDIYDKTNSPVKIVHHYENGILVPTCARGTDDTSFFTKAPSRWSGSGWISANGAYGLNADGTSFALYNYTLNEKDEATITKYNGNSWSVYIPTEIDGYKVIAIGSSAFRYKDVGRVVIPDTVTSIGASAFYNASSLKQVNLSENLTVIGPYAFESCRSLETINIPDSVTEIENSAFDDCSSLKDIILSKSLKNLGLRAFAKTAVETIEIPKSLEQCGGSSGPFYDCEKLKTVVFEKGTSQIPGSLFAGCTGLEEIDIPDTVTSIGASAFYNASSLKQVNLSENLTVIGPYAFESCRSLETINIPDSVTEIGNSAFSSCTSLKEVELSDRILQIYGSTFRDCKALQSITIPARVSEIGSSAFSGCVSLESCDFADKAELKTIRSSAFYNCVSLQEAILPPTVITIGDSAYSNCTSLKKASVPQITKTIGSQAFYGCENLSEVNISDYSITTMNSSTFKDCSSLVSIVLPKGLTTIGSQAFMNCTSLVNVTIPESVTSIDSTAFSYPAKTTIYGKTGSYAETFANDGGFTFVDNSIPVEGIILKDGVENVTLDEGETYRAEFEVYPEDANDVITLTANNSNVTIKGHEIYARYAGDTVITATSTSGLTYEFNIHIRSIKGIEVITNPTKTSYVIGEEFDKAGMVVQVNYYDGSSRIVDDYTISGFNSSKEGVNTVTVKWMSPTSAILTTYSTTFTVNIVDPTPKLTGIYIETLPDKLNYELREKLDVTGLVVKGTYTDNSTKVLTDYKVTGYNALKSGSQTITIAYGDYTTTFTVSVGVAKTLSAISVAQAPTKTEYYIGDVFSTVGLQLTLTYSDSSTTTVSSGFTTSGFDSTLAGTKVITVSYQGVTTTFSVIVKTPSVVLSENEKSLLVDETVVLTATTDPIGQQITWSSSNNSVATVTNGVVTAKSKGVVTITAQFSYNGIIYSETCLISINDYLVGDVNDDDIINGKDVTLLLRHLADWDVKINTKAADINADGDVNGQDVTHLMQYLAGWDVVLG